MRILGKEFFKKEKKIEVAITDQNQMYEAIYKWIQNGFQLDKDNQKVYVTEGFEGNPDTYAIINNISSKAAMIPFRLVSINAKGEETELFQHELLDRLKTPNNYQTWTEFVYTWEAFRLTTGNSIIYAPRLEFGGNNNGKIMPDGMTLMPTQNTEILSGETWMEPVGWYVLDLDAHKQRIDPKDVIHSRMPSLTYDRGKNFMGQSPLKSAITLIFTQNKGYELLASLYKNPMPPGLLVDENQTQPYSVDIQSKLEETWNRKYGSQNSKGAPILTGGKKQWISFMTSTIRDLMIIESTQNGARVLANVLNWPSALMNDTSAMTLDNLKVFIKQAYTDRIKPDLQVLYEDLTNEICPAYARAGETLKLEPDYSVVEELQQDRKTLSEWISIAVNNGIISRNEAREMLELEEIEDSPGMDELTMSFNLVPVDGEKMPDIEEVNKNLNGNEPYE